MKHYYESVPGWFNWEDVYAWAAAEVPDGGTIVEVGCWHGKSMSFLLVELVNVGKRCRVYGVDHFKGSADAGQWMLDEAAARPLKDICLSHCRKAGYAGFTLLDEPSVEAARRFKDGEVWLVYVDGAHDFASVRADLAAWAPKVMKGGWIAGHDWGAHGVVDAVDEMFGRAAVIERPPASWEVQL